VILVFGENEISKESSANLSYRQRVRGFCEKKAGG